MTNKTIMENLHNYLPKDLVNIKEYAKYKTQYDEVIRTLAHIVNYEQRWNSVWYIFDRVKRERQRSLALALATTR